MSKILFIFVLSALSVFLVKGITKEEWAKRAAVYREECQKEVGATQSDIDEVSLKKALTTKTAQCFGACMMKRFKVMDDNGKFVKSAALEYTKFSDGGDEANCKKATEVIESCAGISLPADHCEGAKALFECFREHHADKA